MSSNVTPHHQAPSAEIPGAIRAAKLLNDPKGGMHLSLDDATVLVRYMKPHFFKAGTTFIKEGDSGDGGFMALLIEGDVVVEQITVKRTEPITVRVLGPGSMVGEMGLVDNEPRSASCTASTDVMCAILTRDAIDRMIAEVPATAARVLVSLSSNIAERLRNTARQLKLYARLASAMQEEIDQLTQQIDAGPTRPSN
jgi:CRP-like cAMP-binding protein